jgi:acyl carrier protein
VAEHSELSAVVAAVLGIEPAEVVDAAGPATIAQWSSRKHIELIVRLEEYYQVSFGRSEFSAIQSIADLREALRRKGVPR